MFELPLQLLNFHTYKNIQIVFLKPLVSESAVIVDLPSDIYHSKVLETLFILHVIQ